MKRHSNIPLYIITAIGNEGAIWETTRNTPRGRDNVIKEIMEDDSIVKYTVESKLSYEVTK